MMAVAALRIQRIKTKRSRFSVVAVPLLVALNVTNGVSNYLANAGVFDKQDVTWLALWGQAGLLWSVVFLPLLVSIRAATLCRMEHQNENWQRMASYGAAVRVAYRGKLLSMAVFVLASQAMFSGAVLVAGAGLGFALNSGELAELLLWAALGAVGAFSIAVLQVVVGIVVRSFAATVAVGLAGAVSGLAVTIVAPVLQTVYPYSQIAAGMRIRELAPPGPVELVVFIALNSALIVIVALIGQSIVRWRRY
jgi:hypothetical protein